MIEFTVFAFLALIDAADSVGVPEQPPETPVDSGFDEPFTTWDDDVRWYDASRVIFPKNEQPFGNTLSDEHPQVESNLNDFRADHNTFLEKQLNYMETRSVPVEWSERDFKIPKRQGSDISLEVKFSGDDPSTHVIIQKIEEATKRLVSFSDQNNWDMPRKIRVALLPDEGSCGLNTSGRTVLTSDGVEFQVILGNSLRRGTEMQPDLRFASRGGSPSFSGVRAVHNQYSEYNGGAHGHLHYAGLLHEYGHAVHQLNSPSEYWTLSRGGDLERGAPWASSDDKNLASRHLSHYAGHKEDGGMLEFVAEYFAAKMVNMPVTEEITEMYERYAGPAMGPSHAEFEADGFQLQSESWPWAPLPLDDGTLPMPTMDNLLQAYRELGESTLFLEDKTIKNSYRAFDGAEGTLDANRKIASFRDVVIDKLVISPDATSDDSYWKLRDLWDRSTQMCDKLSPLLRRGDQPFQKIRDVPEMVETLKSALQSSKDRFQFEAAFEKKARSLMRYRQELENGSCVMIG